MMNRKMNKCQKSTTTIGSEVSILTHLKWLHPKNLRFQYFTFKANYVNHKFGYSNTVLYLGFLSIWLRVLAPSVDEVVFLFQQG